MDERQIAIRLKGIKKMYKLGQIGGGTLQADLQSWWARKRGKEDPNTKIGQEQRLVGKTFMALNGIDLTIYQGEAVGIIGKNGAGKSTLLKLLSKVTAPTEGEIDLYGRVASMLEVGTGFNGEMTGRENVYLNGAILGMTKEEIDRKMEDIIAFSEVRDFIDTPVKRYSSGMYVKLAFSVAAHLDSEIMIMDEVLAVGDMAFQKKCLEKMRSVAKKEGRTVLYVSHNMNTIRQLCDRCIVLDEGKVIFEGDVEKAISIYMYDDSHRREVQFDLSNNRMAHLPPEIRGKITHLLLCDKQSAEYEFDEAFKIKLRIEARDTLKDLSLRVEMRALSGYPVGVTMIEHFASMCKGETADYCFALRLDGLVTGEYAVCLVLYESDQAGNFVDIDAIFPAFIFEVRDSVNRLKIVWHHSNWGYIKFPDIKLLSSNKAPEKATRK